MNRLLLLPLLLELFAPAPLGAEEVAWKPANTWVFAVGVLNYDDPGLTTYPDEGRVDAIMLDTFRKRGVPDDHIVFLKNEQAKKAIVVEKFVELLKRTAADDTLVFYYDGHGARNYQDPERPVHFITYDTAARWTVAEILDTIEQHFRGSQAWLMADCCHSGALDVEAARRKNRIGYGVLTSAHVSSISTGNWTFTECLVDALAGKRGLDFDDDGSITFAEAARHCEHEMAFAESQRVGYRTLGGFSPDLVLAPATGERTPPRPVEQFEGYDELQWWRVKILETKGDQKRVHWIGFDKKYDEWLGPDRLRSYKPKTYAKGTAVEIQWQGTWYAGQVLDSQLGLHLVNYKGFPAADNEWVTSQRLRVKAQSKTRPQPTE